jgi:hypothetical protein
LFYRLSTLKGVGRKNGSGKGGHGARVVVTAFVDALLDVFITHVGSEHGVG